jgi:hypothetical protein
MSEQHDYERDAVSLRDEDTALDTTTVLWHVARVPACPTALHLARYTASQ